MGLRLRDWGTPDFSIRDMWVIVRTSRPDSALYRAMYPEEAEWSLTDHLLAVVADGIHMQMWQNAGNGSAKKPKPIPRPGVDSGEHEEKTFTGQAEPLADISEWLGWQPEEDD